MSLLKERLPFFTGTKVLPKVLPAPPAPSAQTQPAEELTGFSPPPKVPQASLPPEPSAPQAEPFVIEELAPQPARENPIGSPCGRGGKPLSEAEFEAEARRIARELVKLYHAGAVKGPDDPDAVFYACLIRDFGAVFIPAAATAHNPLRGSGGFPDSGPDDSNPPPGAFIPGKPYRPTEQQRVRIPYGLSKEQQKRWLQDDLDSLNN